jgi:glycosyltransferase involved in cell wall biosynthesis
MRIVHIIPSLGRGGAERLVIDIVRKLQDVGHEVLLVLFSRKNDYKNECTGLNLQSVKVSVQASPIRKNNVDVTDLQSVFDDFEPDVIHTHLFEAEFKTRFCTYAKAKWFSHGHDNMVQLQNFSFGTLFSKQALIQFYEKTLLVRNYLKNGGNKFIGVSKDNHEFLQKALPCFSSYLLPNAINVSKFENKLKEEKDGITLKLINVGSLNTNKNQVLLLDVAEELMIRNVRFTLTIVGDGPLKGELLNITQDRNLNNHVKFTGMVDNVQELYWQSDVYVHSSFSESFGLTMLEAMAGGLPVVCTDSVGNRDLVVSGENGILLKDHSVKNFTNELLSVFTNRSKYNEMSDLARKFSTKFDIAFYVQNLLQYYNKPID